MNSIQTIYDSLWNKSLQNFKNNLFEFDYHLNNKFEDYRRGLTVIARPNSRILFKISEFLEEVKLIEPGQYFYDEKDIHVTILSIISCYDGFNIERVDKEAYIDLISKSIRNEGPIKILFKGITASSSCIMVQGFPIDNRLKLLRNQLRDSFRNSSLEYSIDKRYTIETAHSSVIRFKDHIMNNSSFIECLDKYRHYNFGITEINEINLVTNDWYMTDTIVSKIKTFDLSV